MTSQRSGQTPLKSRWSDSTLSTAAPTPISPTQSSRLPGSYSRQVAPQPPFTPIDETRSSTDAPTLAKSNTSASQRSGEITIMLDTDVPDLPRSKSADLSSSTLPATTARTPLRVNAPPVLQLPEDAGEPSPKGLKSRYFRADRTASMALKSPSSLIPSPITPRASQVSSATSTANPVRVRSEIGPPRQSPSPAAASSHGLRPNSHIPASTLRAPPPVSASAMSSDPSASRDRAGSNPSFTQFLQTASPLSLQPSASHHSRARSASSAAASSLPISAMSSVSRRDNKPFQPSEPMPPAEARHAKHFRNPSSVSSMTDGSRVTKKRLKSALPPSPPPAQNQNPKASRASVQSKGSKAGSILSRLGTISRFGRADPSRYQKLDEGNERQIPLDDYPRSEHNDPEEALGVDLSSLEGPTRHVPDDSRTHPALRRNQTMHRRTSEDDILEAKGHLTGGLGIGMAGVVTKTLQYPDNPAMKSAAKSPILRKMTLKRNLPDKAFGQTQVGQQTAEYEGTVIAVEEDLGVDISNAEGSHVSKAPRELDDFIADNDPKQSYYFPPDPQMPDWRPFTMTPWYLIILIILALAFAATIETLVQVSQRRAAEPTPSGLLTFKNADDVSTSDWFTWKYLPEAIFVTYGVFFQATDFEVRRLEPYWQMAQVGGAKAEESLNLDYLTFMSYLIPFKAFRHRQWAVMQSSLATILASAVIPVLFSAALDVDPDRDERRPDKDKYVRMGPAWSRVLEVCLLLVALLTTLLLIQLRRKSGLQNDLKGIAGICSMATKSHILIDFKGLDIANHRVIHKQLAHRRYILHKSSLWQGEYITRVDPDDVAPKNSENPHPMALHLYFLIGFSVFLTFFLIFIPIVEFNPAANIVTERAPWFLTLLATLIKLAWTNLETGVRMLQPFYVLSRRWAPPKTLLLDYTGTVPGYMPIKAALNGHLLLAAVGVGSILCEVLTVVVSSFNIDGWLAIDGQAGTGAETRNSYLSSFSLAIAIPVLLAVILGAVYLRRRHAFLPRQPATIASVLAFVAQSKMLYDFVAPDDDDDGYERGAEPPRSNFRAMLARFAARGARGKPDVAQRTVALYEARGKRFGLGWYRGRDGMDHLGVDEEELLADYNHGIDWSKGRMGPHDIGAWERF